MQRAIRLVEGSIKKTQDEILPASEGRHQFWRVDEEGSDFVARLVTSEYQQKARQLKSKLGRARFERDNARGLLSSLSGKRRRLESEISALEAALTDVLQRDEMYGQGWYCISFSPEDARLTKNWADLTVEMRSSVFEKARAFQGEQPLYLGTWSPLSSGETEGKFWWHRDKFWVSKMYTQEEARLLLWGKGRREERKLKRLAKAMVAAKEAREEAGRERIPEEVRLLVWERDGGRCVKCGSTEDLEFDHIIPISKGGSNTEKNVQLLCATCNREKRDRIV